MSKRGHGQICTYCRRTLESVSSLSRVAATKDHVHPKSLGGRATVWACRQCNSIKRDMTPEAWIVFMASYPEWWRRPEFAHHGRKNTALMSKGAMGDTVAKEILSEPSDIPVEYSDPLAQAAFVAVYRKRKHMLRVTATSRAIATGTPPQ